MTDVKKKDNALKKNGKKKRSGLRRLIGFLIAAAVIAAAGWIAWRQLKNEYTVVYQAYTAGVGSISNSLSFSGTVQAISNTTYTASAATTVRSVYVTEGDDVLAGDKLLRLANGQTVEAEFDGRVNQLYVAEGDKVSSGASLAQVVDFTHMKVSIRVDEYDISSVHVGTECRVTTTATGESFRSEVASINYVSSSSGSVAYYTATAYVDVSGTVYPGMQVSVTVPQEEAVDVVILKEDAISFDAFNQAFVYRMNGDGQMEESRITTGVSNGNYVEITSGLKDGDVIYAVSKEKKNENTSLFSSLFGGQSILGGGQQQTQQQRQWNQQRTNNNPRENTGGGAPR